MGGLQNYIIRRIILMIPTLIGVTLLIFAITQVLSPRQRAALYVTERTVGQIDDVIKKYHLDAPFYVQYFIWIKEVLHGNLGWSKKFTSPVLGMIISRAPASIELAMVATPVIVLSGIFLGKLAAVHRDKAIDHISRATSIIGWSLPSFWLGILLLAIFYSGLGWFSPGRLGDAATLYVTNPSNNFKTYTGMFTIDGLLNGQPWITLDALSHMILPVVSLTVQIVALIVRVMRSTMLEVLGKGYISAARAKGLNPKEVVNKHATRNALLPVVTLAGMLTAGLMNGVVITEIIFRYPGLGQFAATCAVPPSDLPGVLGFALFAGVLFVVANLVVDISYAYLDPRIRLG